MHSNHYGLWQLVILLTLGPLIAKSSPGVYPAWARELISNNFEPSTERLGCDDIARVNAIREINGGAVKRLTLVEFSAPPYYVLSQPKGPFPVDFESGVDCQLALSGHERVVPVVGVCLSRSQVLLPFYPLGSLLNLGIVINAQHLSPNDDTRVRRQIAIDYIDILILLHYSPIGKLVMCDSVSLSKLLSQILLTSDLRIVLADLDALPEVLEGVPIKCGRRDLPDNGFNAPEQVGANDKIEGYDEKTDIWKAPDVLDYILNMQGGERMDKIRRRCKSATPKNRPTAKELKLIFLAE